VTRDELDALTERLREHPGGVPRAVAQAMTAVDAYLTLAEAHPQDPVLQYEHGRILELWETLQDALAALSDRPHTLAGPQLRLAQAA
jgi:hypothetical protein